MQAVMGAWERGEGRPRSKSKRERGGRRGGRRKERRVPFLGV